MGTLTWGKKDANPEPGSSARRGKKGKEISAVKQSLAEIVLSQKKENRPPKKNLEIRLLLRLSPIGCCEERT